MNCLCSRACVCGVLRVWLERPAVYCRLKGNSVVQHIGKGELHERHNNNYSYGEDLLGCDVGLVVYIICIL